MNKILARTQLNVLTVLTTVDYTAASLFPVHAHAQLPSHPVADPEMLKWRGVGACHLQSVEVAYVQLDRYNYPISGLERRFYLLQ